MNEVLNKAIALAYVAGAIAVVNLEVAIHEIKLEKDDNAGKFQHRAEKLKSAFNNMFKTMEANLENDSMDEIRKRLELMIDNCWE